MSAAAKWAVRQQVWLTEAMQQALDDEADRRDVSVPSVLRDLICEHFELEKVEALPTEAQRAQSAYWATKQYRRKGKRS